MANRHRRKTPQFYYSQQKQSAKARGIEWQFTFETWWEVWEKSGKWNQRGCKRGQYVMARHNDTGPYAPWNVSIVESSKNNKDGMSGWQAKKRAREGHAAMETANGPTTAEDPKIQPASLGYTCGTMAANSAVDIAIVSQIYPDRVQLYGQPQCDVPTRKNGNGDHKFPRSTSGAISRKTMNKNLFPWNKIFKFLKQMFTTTSQEVS